MSSAITLARTVRTVVVTRRVSPAAITGNLLTAKGDMIYASAATTPARLAIGITAGQILQTSAGGIPEWVDFPAHATSHTDGSDDIQNATAAQKGLATAAQITKLDDIAAGATANPTAVDPTALAEGAYYASPYSLITTTGLTQYTVYYRTSGGTWAQANATTDATGAKFRLGIALSTTLLLVGPGWFRFPASSITGSPVDGEAAFMCTTDGKVCVLLSKPSAAGNAQRVLGHWYGTNGTMRWEPEPAWQKV